MIEGIGARLGTSWVAWDFESRATLRGAEKGRGLPGPKVQKDWDALGNGMILAVRGVEQAGLEPVDKERVGPWLSAFASGKQAREMTGEGQFCSGGWGWGWSQGGSSEGRQIRRSDANASDSTARRDCIRWFSVAMFLITPSRLLQFIGFGGVGMSG